MSECLAYPSIVRFRGDHVALKWKGKKLAKFLVSIDRDSVNLRIRQIKRDREGEADNEVEEITIIRKRFVSLYSMMGCAFIVNIITLLRLLQHFVGFASTFLQMNSFAAKSFNYEIKSTKSCKSLGWTAKKSKWMLNAFYWFSKASLIFIVREQIFRWLYKSATKDSRLMSMSSLPTTNIWQADEIL